MLAIANAMEDMSRVVAAHAAGMDRPARRDAFVRYEAEGVDGLYDRLTSGRPPPLTEAETETASRSARIFRGADAETDGVNSWTLPDLRRWIEDILDKRLRPQRLSSILRREGFSRQRSHDGNCREGSFAPELLGSGRGAEPLTASRYR